MHPTYGHIVAHIADVAKDAYFSFSVLPPLGVDNKVDPPPLVLIDLTSKSLLEDHTLAVLNERLLRCEYHKSGPFIV
jgi:hypothetical protein